MATVLFLTTIDKKNADEFSKKIVEGHYAACVNKIPGILSTYYWENTLCQDNEVLLLIKSSEMKANVCFEYMDKIHPYDVPEIIQLTPAKVHKGYDTWVADMCQQ